MLNYRILQTNPLSMLMTDELESISFCFDLAWLGLFCGQATKANQASVEEPVVETKVIQFWFPFGSGCSATKRKAEIANWTILGLTGPVRGVQSPNDAIALRQLPAEIGLNQPKQSKFCLGEKISRRAPYADSPTLRSQTSLDAPAY
jgi:hypothetical protein